MADPNLPMLEDAVSKLTPFLDEIVFVGGITLGLLITDTAAAPTEAIERIALLYAIEKEIRGRSPDERRRIRNARARPLLESMHHWLKTSLATLSRKSNTAAAIHYALSLWDALVRYLDDGRIEIDNSAAERALRCVAIGIERHQQHAIDGGLGCLDQPSDFFLAEHLRQVQHLLRIGRLGGAPGLLQNLRVKEAQSAQALRHRVLCQLPLTEHGRLILTNVLRP